jgi:predicted NBD/HSP70 family sugar kinase
LVITGVEIDIALCNLKGEILDESRVELNEDMNAAKIIELAFHNTDKMISSIDKDKIILISLGSPETFSKETGIIKWSPYIHDWVGVNLKSVFQDKYKKAVIIKDHVKLETLGEHWHSFNNVYNLVYIVITKGIGSGVIIDSELREGKNGYLGEIGFLPILNQLDDNKSESELKGLGPFEAKCDIKKIEKLVNSYLMNKGIVKSTVSFDEIVQYYNTNTDVKKLIHEEIVGVLALGIASVIIMLDPEIVVINGEIVWLGEDFLQLLKKKLYSMIPFKTEVVYSKLKERSKIYGAIRNGLIYIEDQMFNNIESFLKSNYKNDKI